MGTRRLVTRRKILTSAAALPFISVRPAVAQQDVLRVVAPWEFTSNEPADVGFILTRMGVARTLVQVRPDGRLEPGVARAWAVGDDGLTWRFELSPGGRFHDGTAVTPKAVVNSLRRAFSSGESLSAVPLADIGTDGDTITIRTNRPFAPLPAFMVDYSAVILAPASYGANGRVERVIGDGPFMLSSIDGRTVLDLARFEGGIGPRPAVRRARYTAVASGDARANIAIAGDADLVFTLAPTALPRIASAGRMRTVSLTIPRVRPVAMNIGLPQFADRDVRRALSLSIDRAGIAAAILRHPESAATQLMPPILADWHDPALPPLAHNVAEANRSLDALGWLMGPDGVRTKDGVRFAARLLTIANRPELPPMATALQEQFRKVGLDVAIDAGPASLIPSAIRDGTMQMTMFARTYVNVPDVIATIIPDFTRERSTWGTMNWPGRVRVASLAETYLATFDEAARAPLRRAITRILHEEMPILPVAWFEHTLAVAPRVHGLVVDPFETRYLIDRVTLA
jgi:peptide/nickel transport system substrate-binding protein